MAGEEGLSVLGAFVCSALGAGIVLRYSHRAGLVDVPNHRSSHAIPVPRGGGVAVVLAIIFAVGYEVRGRGWPPHGHMAILGAAVALLTAVGWLDDRGHMPVRLRFLLHVACGLAVALLVDGMRPQTGMFHVAWLAWWLFWTTASINIVNFMDGIDGMIASQGIVYGIFLFVLLQPQRAGAQFGLVLAAACGGFLLWNWAPAKIFLGDVGSGPLGLLFVAGGALALEGAHAVLVFLPLFPLFLDALVTLLRRIRRGEQLTEPHRTHLYQRVANGGLGHAPVSITYAGAAAVGALSAVLVKDAPPLWIGVTITGYVIAVLVAWRWVDRRFPLSPTAGGAQTSG